MKKARMRKHLGFCGVDNRTRTDGLQGHNLTR